MKLIIELRSVDSFGKKINNTKDKNQIIKFCSDFFNCESIKVEKWK